MRDVRSNAGRGEPLERALAALTRALNLTGAPWMVIGGIAVIARGVRRMTTDIDVAVQGDRVSIPTLLKALAAKQITSPGPAALSRFLRTGTRL